MKRSPIKKIGRKGREWINARRKRIKELAATGKYQVVGSLLYGSCTDCGKWGILDLDHIGGRGGEDPHRAENLDAICRECHIKRHEENHMKQKEEKTDTSKKSSKANWMKPHSCVKCKHPNMGILLCPKCGELSV